MKLIKTQIYQPLKPDPKNINIRLKKGEKFISGEIYLIKIYILDTELMLE